MPKRIQLSRVNSASGSEEGNDSGQWHRNMMAVLKSKFRRNRMGSVDSENHSGLSPEISMKGKCATLPARVPSLERGGSSKPRTLYWMVGVVDELEDSLTGSMLAIQNGSDESVDSGFHPNVSEEISSLKRGSPVIGSRSGVSPSLYDKSAVEKAFGPMKDVGRWYSSYSSTQHDQEDRYIHRPMAQIPLQTLDEEERLTSRPLPPIPSDPRASSLAAKAIVAPTKQDDDVLYDNIQHKMLGSNGLTLNLRNLAKYGWYWGPITRVEAEERLVGAKDGTFLVRDSSDDRYLLSLSFHSQGKTLHTRIEYYNGNFSFYSFPDADTEGYPSVVELIERSMQYSKGGVFCFSRARAAGSPAVPVRLLKPFSRFNHVRTLQHYCRFVIRQSIRFDKIRQLPLPRHVHGFLEQSQF